MVNRSIKLLCKNYVKTKKGLISVVALLCVLVITCLTVVAWTETTSSLQILGNGDISDFTYTNANIGSGSSYDNKAIDLSEYVRKSGNLHFAEASSANGEDFFFPKLDSTTTTTANLAPAYREGNISDKNVGYISFSLDIKSVGRSRDYMFEQVPTITIGDEDITDNTVRVAITDSSTSTTKIYSNIASATEMVISSTTGNTAATNVNAFSDYKSDSSNCLFTIGKDQTSRITISIWLQLSNTNAKAYTGQEVKIENFKIVPTYSGTTIKVHFDSNKCTASATYNGKSGTSLRVPEGETVTLNSTAANTMYTVFGWYKGTSATGSAVSNTTSHSFTVPENCESEYNFYVDYGIKSYRVSSVTTTDGFFINDGGTVTLYVNDVAQAHTSKTVQHGDKYSFKASNANDYTFKGWYDSPSGGNQLSSDTTYTVTSATENKQIYAQFTCKTKYIYLKTNSNWETDSARFAAYFFGNGEKWVSMETVVADSVYRVAVPSGYPNVIFVRMNGANTSNDWNNKWNQSPDLSVPSNNYQMYTVSGWGSGSWGSYYVNINFKDNTDTTWVDDDNARMFLENADTGNWYEMSMGQSGWTVSVGINYTNIKFHRRNFEHNEGYNTWDAGNRETKTTYTVTDSTTGAWS